ncbi:MAG: hypothetical protein PHY00_03235 [Bacilli bacterium]|nr:hypothetical protein [Bacilli bacterium]
MKKKEIKYSTKKSNTKKIKKEKEVPVIKPTSKKGKGTLFITIILIALFLIIGALIYLKYQQSNLAQQKIINNKLVTSGSGLYADTYETGLNPDEPYSSKYHFRGASVDNYLILNDKCFRIINIAQNDALKIMYIGSSINNTCDNINLDNITITWDENGGNVFPESSVNSYLNTWLMETKLSQSPHIIDDATWYIGGLRFNSSSNLTDDIKDERQSVFDEVVVHTGVVGLINASDYMKANELPCLEGAWRSEEKCGIFNYLYSTHKFWTMNKTLGDFERVWAVENGRMESKLTTNNDFQINPVVYLKSNLKINGNGSSSNPYIIIDNE